MFAFFASFASHFCSRAEKSRLLSLPPRCAFVITKAQRAPTKPGSRVADADFISKNGDFPPPARCAFVMTKAQRASYGWRRGPGRGVSPGRAGGITKLRSARADLAVVVIRTIVFRPHGH
jgi:hypothetical protein